MAHEVSVTKRNKDGTYSNFASVGVNAHKRPLRTKGKFKFKTEGEAVSAAIARSKRSNFGKGNNTINESVKEERK